MRKITLIILLVPVLAFAQAQKTTKGKLFIIGGGSRPDAMVDRMISESGLQNGGYGVILPMSSSYDSSAYWANEQFVKKGITNVYELEFRKGVQPTEVKLDSLRSAKFIYITGGDQNRFMEVAIGTPIIETIHKAFKNGALIGGTSAGAAVMSALMITGNELKYPEGTLKNIEEGNVEIKTGLGLIEGVVIDQHFVKRSRYSRLISVVIEHPEVKGIAIDEATAILVKGRDAEVIGESQVIVIENPKRSKVVRNGKLGAAGLRVDIFLEGDHFLVN